MMQRPPAIPPTSSTSDGRRDAVRASYDVLVASRGLAPRPTADSRNAPRRPVVAAEFDASTLDAARLARRFVELKRLVAERKAASAEIAAHVESLRSTADPIMAHEKFARAVAALQATLKAADDCRDGTGAAGAADASTNVDEHTGTNTGGAQHASTMSDLASRYALLRCQTFASIFEAADVRTAALAAEQAKLADEVDVLSAILAVAHTCSLAEGGRGREGVEGAAVAEGAAPHRATCPICFEEEVDTCNVPCGHTLCSACSEKSAAEQRPSLNRCPTCRAAVSMTVKLFFS